MERLLQAGSSYFYYNVCVLVMPRTLFRCWIRVRGVTQPREARFVSSICFAVNVERQDLLSSTSSITTERGKVCVFDLLRYQCRKTGSFVFNQLHHNRERQGLCLRPASLSIQKGKIFFLQPAPSQSREARFVSSTCFAVNAGRQDLLSSTSFITTERGKVWCFNLLHCQCRKARSVVFTDLFSREYDLYVLFYEFIYA
ncbi:uncharacterized protein LOC128035921 [Gossypium raimondii]|uniref:uncharacterized protein LOC128035921 n=1 Tax=Gossypium raimondii TaxID=29730 RepID=UPI00227D3749|nr:uncharacterized protein LOC128035921 [Gossypium raimondii]